MLDAFDDESANLLSVSVCLYVRTNEFSKGEISHVTHISNDGKNEFTT